MTEKKNYCVGGNCTFAKTVDGNWKCFACGKVLTDADNDNFFIIHSTDTAANAESKDGEE